MYANNWSLPHKCLHVAPMHSNKRSDSFPAFSAVATTEKVKHILWLSSSCSSVLSSSWYLNLASRSIKLLSLIPNSYVDHFKLRLYLSTHTNTPTLTLQVSPQTNVKPVITMLKLSYSIEITFHGFLSPIENTKKLKWPLSITRKSQNGLASKDFFSLTWTKQSLTQKGYFCYTTSYISLNQPCTIRLHAFRIKNYMLSGLSYLLYQEQQFQYSCSAPLPTFEY